ncbi:ferritin-like domain-containing protein [Streptomyces meridianus]|uniref:Ferritin-like domain-containing protein n=1 Tax=Streptomyces meridianus TaxID=2938945 RepID=A0ABT0X8Q9_9ACTN|nr:ferritin-like domain-containing protein [Streptomyces meridianus]MCM2578911.1 ferritin-like domain-containing protein [Streptomyces meridianus]
MTAHGSSGTTGRAGTPDSGTLEAAQAALRAEHAVVYGYGVVGGRIDDDRRAEARSGCDAHRARRDAMHRAVRRLGGRPEASAAAYAMPFPVPDAAAAARLAAELEDRVAGVYADLVQASNGSLRRDAASALREAAVRAVRWRGRSVAFPGLAERSESASPPGSTSGTPDSL